MRPQASLLVLAGAACLQTFATAQVEHVACNVFLINAIESQTVVTGVKVDQGGKKKIQLPVRFDTADSGSQLENPHLKEVPLYFQYVGFLVPAGPNIAEQILTFRDFMLDDKEGVYVTQNLIGFGKPPQHVAVEPEIVQPCPGPVENCLHSVAIYDDESNNLLVSNQKLIFSRTINRHLVPLALADKKISLVFSNQEKIDLDFVPHTTHYTLPEDVIFFSLLESQMTLWQNKSHMSVHYSPKDMQSLQDSMTLFTMIVAAVCFIDVSVRTTIGMTENNVSAQTFSQITRIIMFDLCCSALLVMVLKKFTTNNLLDSEIFFVPNSRWHDAIGYVCVAQAGVCTVATGMCVSLKTAPRSSRQRRSLWVLARLCFEVATLTTAAATTPPIMGVEYAFSAQLGLGVMVAGITGRDCYYLIKKGGAVVRGAALLMLASVQLVVSDTMLRPVLWRSQSFGSDNQRVQLYSLCLVIMITCTGMLIGPSVATSTLRINQTITFRGSGYNSHPVFGGATAQKCTSSRSLL